MTQQRTVMMLGMWVDDPPTGTPGRFTHLPELAATMGLGWQITHHSILEPAAWTRHPPAGIVLSGSRHCLGEDCTLKDFSPVLHLLAALPQVPVLGICFGHQFLNLLHGGSLGRFGTYREHDDHALTLDEHPLFAGLPRQCPMPENHGQRVDTIGHGMRTIATSVDGVEATAHAHLPRVSVQFHPEYYPRQREPFGRVVLSNWLATL